MIAGVWQQHQLWDGTYTLDDLLDVQEILMVKEENRRRAEAYEDLIRRQNP